MNLHICTISLRSQFLEAIHRSIPSEDDIVWHIARCNGNPVQSELILGDPRVNVHLLTCDETDTSFKMNYIFQQILDSDADSYFCILDDDTVFLKTMYQVYKRYADIEDKFMIIGKQRDKHGNIRLPATLPYECAIDSGNVLCHSHVLGPERWPEKHWDDKFHADFDFWNRCYKHFRLKNTDLVQDIVSVYNLFSSKPDTLEYVR